MPDAEKWLSLRSNGYVVLRGLVESSLVEAALSRISEDLRTNYDPARRVEYDHRSYCPDIRNTPEIEKLCSNRAVAAVVDEALGRKSVTCSPGQIAIRKAHNVSKASEPSPHIDGIPTPENGVAGAQIQSFTALLGIFLTPVNTDFAGNFTVWPGSHVVLQDHFLREGPAALSRGMPQIPLGPPLQLRCAPGDVVLCHYQLAHAAAVNITGSDRIAVFFRLTLRVLEPAIGPHAEANRWAHLTSIWQGWKLQ